MKKGILVIMATLMTTAMTSMAHAGTLSTPEGSCFACKIVVDTQSQDEALQALMGNAAVSDHLKDLIEKQRAAVAQSQGQEAAQQLSDRELLALMIQK